jgi:hypothetical protein
MMMAMMTTTKLIGVMVVILRDLKWAEHVARMVATNAGVVLTH